MERKGHCNICGKHEELTREHVPPKSAFNRVPIETYNYFTGKTEGNWNEQYHHKGVSHYTLCERCNRKTGRWYGTEFAPWVRQSMICLQRAQNSPFVDCTFQDIYPLRIIKQVICMLFSVNPDGFRNKHEKLVNFVQDKYSRLDSGVRIFVFLTVEGHRSGGGWFVGPADPISTGDINLIENYIEKVRAQIESGLTPSEIAHPPLGYIVTFDAAPLDSRLVEISHFGRQYGYKEKAPTLELTLPILPIVSPYPGDYRGGGQILRDVLREQLEMLKRRYHNT